MGDLSPLPLSPGEHPYEICLSRIEYAIVHQLLFCYVLQEIKNTGRLSIKILSSQYIFGLINQKIAQ